MRQSTKDDYHRRIVRVQQYIEAHLGDVQSPYQLAKHAGLSLHHFHRVFKGQTGESLMEFTRRVHLERAARQLRASQRPILELALEAGYASHEAFTRAFASSFGQSPSHFRDLPSERMETHLSTCHIPLPPQMDVKVTHLMQRPVVLQRCHGGYQNIGKVWPELVMWVRQNHSELGLSPDASLSMYGAVPDDPSVTEEQVLRYDACIELPRPISSTALPAGPMSSGQLPGGLYAQVTHRGPYETLSESYLDLIGRWFPQSGYVLAAEPVIEHYMNSPEDTAPKDLITEILVKIEERGWIENKPDPTTWPD